MNFLQISQICVLPCSFFAPIREDTDRINILYKTITSRIHRFTIYVTWPVLAGYDLFVCEQNKTVCTAIGWFCRGISHVKWKVDVCMESLWDTSCRLIALGMNQQAYVEKRWSGYYFEVIISATSKNMELNIVAAPTFDGRTGNVYT